MRKYFFAVLILMLFTVSCGKTDGVYQSTDTDPVETYPETVCSEATGNETYPVTEKVTENETSSQISDTDIAEDILNKMTLEEKVGQLFLARNPSSADEGVSLIKDKHIGGIIFFGRDFKNSAPEKVRELIKSYNNEADLPLLTAVDEEGGNVCRVSLYSAFREERFASPAELYAEGGLGRILSDTAEKSEFLLDLGLNFNLAPVADISTDEDDFIFERTLGLGRDETAEYVSETVKVMNEKGIVSALKHFPGYGNNEDTHTGIAYDNRSLEELRENDLVPFMSGIEAGAPVVMVSHNVVINIDPDMPASLSDKVIGLLRQELGFEGVIMTDDLSMDAIEDFTESGEAAVLAVLAGADLLCCSDIERQYEAVLTAVREGRISEGRLNESVLRLIRLKLGYGILK